MDYNKVALGLIDAVETVSEHGEFGNNMAQVILTLDSNLKLSEFYGLVSPCHHCEQCLALWLVGDDGRASIKDLWKLETENR